MNEKTATTGVSKSVSPRLAGDLKQILTIRQTIKRAEANFFWGGSPVPAALVSHEPCFDLGAGPGGFAEEGEAGLEARLEEKTADGNAPGHCLPAVAVHQAFHDGFQGDAMQWVIGMGRGRWHGQDGCKGYFFQTRSSEQAGRGRNLREALMSCVGICGGTWEQGALCQGRENPAPVPAPGRFCW